MRRSVITHVARDTLAIGLSIGCAILLVKSGLFNTISVPPEFILLASIVVGFFFTTMFTVAPAAVVLGQLSLEGSPLPVIFGAALGAVVGDLFIFLVFRDHFSGDVEELLRRLRARKIKKLLRGKFFKFTAPLMGALIIASPFPDELGLALMGLSKMRIGLLAPVSFVMNAIGVLLVVIAAHALT